MRVVTNSSPGRRSWRRPAIDNLAGRLEEGIHPVEVQVGFPRCWGVVGRCLVICLVRVRVRVREAVWISCKFC